MSDQPQQVSAAKMTRSAGFNQSLMLHPEAGQLSAVAGDVLNNPILFRKLCDRVYELLQKDLRHQRERSYGYGRNL